MKNEEIHHHHRHHHHKKRHLGLKIFLSIVVIVIIAIGAVAFNIYRRVNNSFSSTYIDIPGTTAVNLKKAEPFTTLLIETGNVDSKESCVAAVVASVNPKTKETTFLNFPISDEFPDNTTISAVYTKNGIDGTLNEVKKQLGIPINKVVQVNIDEIGTLIEASGGIIIQNPKAFVSKGYQFNQGTLKLSTTSQVEAYLNKINSKDTSSSIDRIQNVSMALYANLQKLANPKNLKNISYYQSLLDAYTDTVKTNISFSDFETIALKYNKSVTNTSKLNLHPSSTDTDGNKLISSSEINNVKKLFINSLK